MMLRTWMIQITGVLFMLVLVVYSIPRLSPIITKMIDKEVNTSLEKNGFTWANATVNDRNVRVHGSTLSPEAHQEALQNVRTNWFVKNVQDDIQPKAVFPYTMDMQWNGSELTVKGYVPSGEDKLVLLKHIKTLFNENVDVSAVNVAVGAPDSWMELNQQLLRNLRTLQLAKINITNNRIDIAGRADKTKELQQFKETVEAIAGESFIVESHLFAADHSKLVCGKTFKDLLDEEEILFKSSQSVIDTKSDQLLEKLANNAALCADSKITIVGHTDNVGDDADNKQLSYERAQAVKVRLFNRGGIPLERLLAIGKGASEPIDTNDTEAGRANNRRIEFIVEDVL